MNLSEGQVTLNSDTKTCITRHISATCIGPLRWLLLCMIQGLVLIRDGWELLSLDWQS